MKKSLAVLLALLLAWLAVSGCKASETAKPAGTASNPGSLKTIGDIVALDVPEKQISVYMDTVLCAFGLGGTYYRAKADISPDDAMAYFNTDFMDPEYESKLNAIIGPLPIREIEDLSSQILTANDLAALTGRTGQELVDDSWVYSGSYNLESMEFWMNYGPFMYVVVFDGTVPEKDYSTFEDEAGTSAMKVKSAVFSMLGDFATNPD